MLDAYIYDGLRTPIGRHAGALARVRPDDLLAQTIRAVVERAAFKPGQIEDVVMGCTCQAGEDSRNVARHAGLLAGLPVEAGGVTLNRLCGSGLAPTLDAGRAPTCGEGDLFVRAQANGEPDREERRSEERDGADESECPGVPSYPQTRPNDRRSSQCRRHPTGASG